VDGVDLLCIYICGVLWNGWWHGF